MELLAGDRQFPNPSDFPQHIAPFPDATDPLYPPFLHPPDSNLIDHSPNLPPQKLRPIRCGTFDRAIDAGSSEVGFLQPNHLCALNRDGSEYFELPAKEEARNAAENCGVDPVLFGSGAVGEEWNTMLKRGVLEDESSSSSDDNDDSSASVKESGSRKRKRTSKKKLETFLESLVMKVMNKQEQMHNQFIKMLEKRERERIISEEAWKQQEMERMKRDEELRRQEISRSVALISFIHNVLGQENEIPQPLMSSWQKDVSYDPNATPQSFVSSCWEEGGNTIGIPKDTRDDPRNRRWPDAEVQALITLRTALEHKIRVMGSKESIWEEISVGLQAMGYSRSAKKCKEKWANINKYYKQTVGSGKKPVSSPYYRELDILYKNGIGCPENASNIADDGNECKSGQ